MRRAKHGPALFELLRGGAFQKSAVLRPPGLRVVGDDVTNGDSVEAAPGRELRIVRGVPDKAPPNGPLPNSCKGTERVFQLDGAHLRVNLTAVTAAASVFVLSLLLLAAFIWGQRRGEKAGLARGLAHAGQAEGGEAANAIELAKSQPPATHLVESLLESGPPRGGAKSAVARPVRSAAAEERAPAGDAGAMSGPRQGWVRDYTYIVAQEFSGGREADAARAQAFLAERGMAAELVRHESGAIQLITLEGYNHKDPSQKKKADDVLIKQRALGTEYFTSGGGYKLEGYFKTLKKDTW